MSLPSNADSNDILVGCLISVWRDALDQGNATSNSFEYREKGERAVADFIDEIQSNEQIGPLVSTRFITDFITQAVRTLLDTDELRIRAAARREIDRFQLELRQAPSIWRIVIPIVNLRIVSPQQDITIGNVTFRPFSSSIFGNLELSSRRMILSSISLQQNGDDEESFRRLMSSYTFAVVSVSALDVERAIEIGEQSIGLALDVLRLYNVGLVNRRFRERKAYLDTVGMLDPRSLPIFHLNETAEENNLGFTRDRRSFVMPLDVTNDLVEQMDQNGLEIISRCVRDSPGSLESMDLRGRIVSAIRLFGVGVNIRSNPETLVTLVTAFESLFLTTSENRILVILRCSVLITTNFKGRLRVYSDLDQLYKRRNLVIHKGFRDIKNFEIYKLAFLCYRSIVKLAARAEISSDFSSFISWSEEQLLRGPRDDEN